MNPALFHDSGRYERIQLAEDLAQGKCRLSQYRPSLLAPRSGLKWTLCQQKCASLQATPLLATRLRLALSLGLESIPVPRPTYLPVSKLANLQLSVGRAGESELDSVGRRTGNMQRGVVRDVTIQ